MEQTLVVTDVKMKIKGGNGMKAICSITINGLLSINDIRVIENRHNQLLIAMPSKKMPGGSFKDMANPVNAAGRKIIEDAVLKTYNESITLDEKVLEMIG